jgi:hypothetical protein
VQHHNLQKIQPKQSSQQQAKFQQKKKSSQQAKLQQHIANSLCNLPTPTEDKKKTANHHRQSKHTDTIQRSARSPITQILVLRSSALFSIARRYPTQELK